MINRFIYILLLFLLGGTLSSQVLHPDQWIYKSRKRIGPTAIGPLGNVYLIKKKNHTIFSLLKLTSYKKQEWEIKLNKETTYSFLEIKELVISPNQDVIILGNCSNHFKIQNKDTTVVLGETNPNHFDKQRLFSFIISIRPDGSIKWAKTSRMKGKFLRLAINNNGAIYIAHMIHKSLSKKNEEFAVTHENPGSYFLRIARYSSSGEDLGYLPLVQHSTSYPSSNLTFDSDNNLYLTSYNAFTEFRTKEVYPFENYLSSLLVITPEDSIEYFTTFKRTMLFDLDVMDSMIYLVGEHDRSGSFLKQISFKDKSTQIHYLHNNKFDFLNIDLSKSLVIDHYQQVHLIYPFSNNKLPTNLESIYQYNGKLTFRSYKDFAKSSFSLEHFDKIESQKVFNSRVVKIKDINHSNFKINSLKSNGFYTIMSGSYKDSNIVSDIYGEQYSLHNPTKKKRYFFIKSKAKKIVENENHFSKEINSRYFINQFIVPPLLENPTDFSVKVDQNKWDFSFKIDNANGLFTVKLFHKNGGKDFYNKNFYINGELSDSISFYYIPGGEYILQVSQGNQMKQTPITIYNNRFDY